MVPIKLLGHTGTPTNFQNNCINIIRFGVDIARTFLHWEIRRDFRVLGKFFNSGNSIAFLRTNPHMLPPLSAVLLQDK